LGSYAIFTVPAHVIEDEVQRTSEWVHDFQPEFPKFGILKRDFPLTLVIPIISVLWIHDCHISHLSFNRPNLFSEVVKKAKRP
jgi:superfamily II DNA helicase RecQ